MIAPLRRTKPTPRWHAAFLAMLPAIATHAQISFRHLDPDAREDAVAECIANALVAFVRLVQLKKTDIAYPTVLARYAVAQVRDGRKVGGHLNIKDVLSEYCQQRKGIVVERLDHFDEEENQWKEAVVQDTRTAPVSEIVAFRCDFADWLSILLRRDRQIAKFLSVGNRTSEAAKKFWVSAGRISQVRRELQDSWRKFQGEQSPKSGSATAVP